MTRIILFGDFNHNDLDDEIALIVASYLHKMGTIELLGVIANTNPAQDRAHIARGLLDELGMYQVPVGVGSTVTPNPEPCPGLPLITYMSTDDERLIDGHELILDILGPAQSKEITLVVNSALTDLTIIPERLLINKVKKVVFMGGVSPQLSPEGYFLPGDAMNVLFDKDAAAYIYQLLQDLRIPVIITTRTATFAATLDHSIFDKMGKIGESFKSRIQQNTQNFWLSCCAPAGSPIRGMLGISRDRAWFVKIFCGGIDPNIPDDGDIIPFIKSHTLPVYDAINLIAAVETLMNRFMTPKVAEVNGVPFSIVGWSQEENGIKDSVRLVKYMNKILKTASN
jgi:inosine-uridine nucleoside N-ribohydrolase